MLSENKIVKNKDVNLASHQWMCGAWDPCSISEEYDPNKFAVGTIARGRDRRYWTVKILNNQHQYQQQQIKKHEQDREQKKTILQKFHVWVLLETERPLERKSMYCECERNLFELQWWKWSTLPGIEQFCVQECGQGGDCLFASVATGLLDVADRQLRRGYIHLRDATLVTTIGGLRNIAAAQITASNVYNFLVDEEQWRQSAEAAPLQISEIVADPYHWDTTPLLEIAQNYPHHAAEKLQQIIRTKGNLYWGDTTTLELLCKSIYLRSLRVGFLLFRGSGTLDPMYITSVPASQVKYLVMLFNDTNRHWRLVVFHIAPHTTPLTYVRRRKIENRLPTSVRILLEASWLKDWRRTIGYQT